MSGAMAMTWIERAAQATYEAMKRPPAEIPTERLNRVIGYLSRRGRRRLVLACIDCGKIMTDEEIGDEVAEGLLCQSCADARWDEEPGDADPPREGRA